ncbi:hypothetical protein PAL_GLEAN10013598 [Pteropus alecto]|uniref:Uncharacterized protein n=1 Tax=Pteropus alecto TaxID=9402 RepID=L5JWW2_PTEAL|nr:hypothetical protein PAL_GLEAN10013598 [Pteropus alecto]
MSLRQIAEITGFRKEGKGRGVPPTAPLAFRNPLEACNGDSQGSNSVFPFAPPASASTLEFKQRCAPSNPSLKPHCLSPRTRPLAEFSRMAPVQLLMTHLALSEATRQKEGPNARMRS